MGTFSIIPSSLSVTSGTWKDNTAPAVYGAVSLSTLLQNLIGSPPPYPRVINSWDGVFHTEDAVLRLGLSLSSNIISLDGNAPISFFGLPVGFILSGATVSINSANNGSDATMHFMLQFSTSIESSNLGFGTQTFSHPAVLPSILQLFFRGVGIHVNNLTVGQQTSRWMGRYLLTGTYIILPFTFDVDPSGDVAPGDVITISSDAADPTPLDLTTLSTVTLQYVNPQTGLLVSYTITPTAQTARLYTFTIPSDLPGIPDDFTFDIFATGTSFSGTVLLGTLSVSIADASGIYRLVPGKTDDTFYDQKTSSPVQTNDVKIPDPFFKTGFLP
jgi:hypothetical protein